MEGKIRHGFKDVLQRLRRAAAKTSNRVIVLRGDISSTKLRERGINPNASTSGFVR
jgi:hypothetical protein